MTDPVQLDAEAVIADLGRRVAELTVENVKQADVIRQLAVRLAKQEVAPDAGDG